MSTRPLTLIAELRAKPGSEAQLGERLLQLVEPSRTEAGCINYDVHQSDDDPAHWVVYENWRSEADLDAHLKTPYLVQFAQACTALLREPMVLRKMSMRSAQIAPQR